MQVKASTRFLRMAPRKVRLVIDVIRGQQVDAALRSLSLMNKQAVLPIKKLVDSAIANATNNFKLDRASLYIAHMYANEGPTLKRWMPRAFGRATTLRQRSSHVHIVLDDQPVTAKVSAVKSAAPAVKSAVKSVAKAKTPRAKTTPKKSAPAA